MGIAVVAGSFIIVRIILLRFVEEKINPIFKTIHSYTTSRKKLQKKIYKEDIEAELNEEVRLWANSQTEEIEKLKQMEKFRKDFLGNVSHELKTPIFNVQGYLLTLLDGGMKDLKINKFYLERAEKSVNRLISIVDDLDSIARLESGEFKLQIESFDLVKVVEEIFEAQELQAKKENIVLVTTYRLNELYAKPMETENTKEKKK